MKRAKVVAAAKVHNQQLQEVRLAHVHRDHVIDSAPS